MVKTKVTFLCNQCGSEQPRWLGRCPDCSSWNSLEEFVERSAPSGRSVNAGGPLPVVLLDTVASELFRRHATGIQELDRVLGGGLIEGAAILLAGEPGIGKSTLALQILAARNPAKALYVCGEESLTQVKERAQRLGVTMLPYVTQETEVSQISAYISREKPDIVVVDSVQTLQHPEVASACGTVTQVRESAALLIQTVKTQSPQSTLILIGHVTKDGSIAGPRVLEHMVDTVLFFEGERVQALRMLRSYKNRFGPSHELGLFEMTRTGLKPISDITLFLDHPAIADVPGSAWTIALEGSRPLAIEIQALTAASTLHLPRRVVNGLDGNRVDMILAILERHTGLRFSQRDVYLNVVGGFKLTDTASDLAVALALASSALNQALPPRSFCYGELGLAGEIRKAPQLELRRSEVDKYAGQFIAAPLLLKNLLHKQFGLYEEA